MQKKSFLFYILLIVFGVIGQSVFAIECPSYILPTGGNDSGTGNSAGVNILGDFRCNTNNYGEYTFETQQKDQKITFDGTQYTGQNFLTFKDKNTISGNTRNGTWIRGGGIADFTTQGNVAIIPSSTRYDTDALLIAPKVGSWGSPGGVPFSDIKISLSSGTQLRTLQPYGDGISTKSTETLTLKSDATINTKKYRSNGIIVKSAKKFNLTLGGKITTEGDQSPAVNITTQIPSFWNPGVPMGEHITTLKDGLEITTKGETSLGVTYNPSGYFSSYGASEKDSYIIAGKVHITTHGKDAYGIFAAGGGSANFNNNIELNGAQITTNGKSAHGVFMTTIRSDIGAETAEVTINSGSLIVVKGEKSIGVHFKDSTSPSNRGTTGKATLVGDATIDAKKHTGTGTAIFMARGSDKVIMKDNVKIKGIVDGGDDYAYADTWIDELIFENYDSSNQFNYAGSLLEYKNFEEVKLKDNTKIHFPENYQTPKSQIFVIDKTSLVDEKNGGTQTTYTINANVNNQGTINLKDGIVGDNLIINGNLTGDGKFFIDIDTNTGKADTITISGDNRIIDFEVDLQTIISIPDKTKIIDLVYATGYTQTGTWNMKLENGQTLYTYSGVSYELFEYDDNSKGHVRALKCKKKPPIAENEEDSTGFNTPITLNILDNDTDTDGIIDQSTIAIIKQPDHGSLSIDLVLGKVKYIPNTNYVGSDTFTYTIKDDDGLVSNIATVTITIQKNTSSSGGGGGGGGTPLVPDYCPDGDYSPSYYDDTCGEEPEIEEPETEEPEIEEPKTEEPKTEEPEIEEPKTEEPKTEEPEPMSSISIPTIEKSTEFIKYPTILPQTGVDIYKKAGLAAGKVRIGIDIDLKRSDFRLRKSTNTNINFWKKILPKVDQDKDLYIVIPKQGLVLPVNNVDKNKKEYKAFLNGNNENFWEELKYGALELPGNPNNYGEIGNKVIAGHSSYWEDLWARYKTHFQKIIAMEKGEEIWIYQKDKIDVAEKKYKRYIYKTMESYNTAKTDVSILAPRGGKDLTLFTCTPIGAAEGRWVIKAIFVEEK